MHRLLVLLRLNPCYSGRWSRRSKDVATTSYGEDVLILVIAVDGLGEDLLDELKRDYRLNPCYSGRWSRRLRILTFNTCLSCLNPCYSGRWSRRGSSQIPL